MRDFHRKFPAVLLLAACFSAAATDRFVNLNNPNPSAPYLDWSSAATNIQDAVDAAEAGDRVIVTNGTYATGARLISGITSNRVAVTKPITLQSVNGPDVTIIEGHQVPPRTNGAAAVRCLYMTDRSALSGFTLTKGATPNGSSMDELYGAGLFCETNSVVVSNCVFTLNSAAYMGGGAYRATLLDCTFTGNASGAGGGAAYSVLTNCVLQNNLATWSGGGAFDSTLTSCTIVNNEAINRGGGTDRSRLVDCTISGNSTPNSQPGGGVYDSTLSRCTLSGNSGGYGGGASASSLALCTVVNNYAQAGGGTYEGVASQCFITGNIAVHGGGGASGGNLSNCAITGNTAMAGGGSYSANLVNCTIVQNSATYGGGVESGTANNCIVFDNVASIQGPNYISSPELMINNSCTTPLPGTGTGNFTNAPLYVSANMPMLMPGSPCVNSGKNSANYERTVDLGGQPRVSGGTVDVGAYELQSPASIISHVWLLTHGFATDGSSDFADPDHDNFDNWQEWRAGTDPRNASSALKTMPIARGASGVTVSWQSIDTLTYYLECSTNLAAVPAFWCVASNIVGQASTTAYTDTAAPAGKAFYRVGVQ